MSIVIAATLIATALLTGVSCNIVRLLLTEVSA